MDVEASAQVYSGILNAPAAPLQSSFSGGLSQGDATLLSQREHAEGPAGSEPLENGNPNKARKPYTISKARERWSEEEHQRFVEAVRLHGRAWRKIEEHIGTKTAVQIRSHAQKFFNKLEKKKEAGELPHGEEDIAIPPPRPKRKPSKPYPRKDGMSSSGFTGTSRLQASSQLPVSSQLPPALQSALQQQQHFMLMQKQQQQQHQHQHQPQHLLFQQQAQQHCGQPPYSLGMEGLLHNFDSLTTATSIGPHHSQAGGEVTDATVAAVTAAASAAAAAAAAAVVAAAGQEVQTHMQAHPPSCFPFFGLPSSAFAQLSPIASALDQAAALSEQAATATAAAYRFGGSAAAAAAAEAAAAGPTVAAAAAAAAAAAEGMVMDDENAGDGGDGGDRNLVEATGTTDGTHISANAHLRGSDGDSACSRETDNQDPSLTMDVTWQGKLRQQQQHQQHQAMQHGGMSGHAGTATRGLVGLPTAGLDPAGHPPWAVPHGDQAAAAAEMLQALGPAQLLAMLSNPLYFAAAANQHFNHTHLAAAAAAATGAMSRPMDFAAARSSGGAAGSSGGVVPVADTSMRTKSRRTAPSVNSGSTGPPLGAKRPLESGSDEGAPPNKKAAREVSDANDDGMEVSPSSPSIQEKHLKAISQPSNTNGNTSGSNESDASKRRHGTTQGEGSNPYSVKDSNTATQTNGCSANGNGHTNGNGHGNGTSAFNPLGHHHGHISHQHNRSSQPGTSCRPKGHGNSAPAQPPGNSAPGTYNGHHNGTQGHFAEGSNGGNGMSGTNNGMSGTNNGMSGTNNGTSGTNGASARDEGRSSSDMEGPTQQQLLQRHHQQEQQAAEEDTAGGQLQQQHQVEQDNTQAAQLQALLASLHGMYGQAAPLMQAYGAAAAAAATAQQIMAAAMNQLPHADLQPGTPMHSQIAAALQQHLVAAGNNSRALQQQQQQHQQQPPVSQGFAPWQGDGSFRASSMYAQNNGLHGLAGAGHHSETATNAQQLAAAAAGLLGLGGSSWAGSSAATAVSGSMTHRPAAGGGLSLDSYAQALAVGAQHYHHHHHHHHLEPQQLQQHAVAAAACAQQQLQAGLSFSPTHQHSSLATLSAAATGSLAGFNGLSGLELLSRAAHSSGAMVGAEDSGEGQGAAAGGRAAGAKRFGASESQFEEQSAVKRQTRML